jgi:glycosyltransferase involved in cell wall biosynthesis
MAAAMPFVTVKYPDNAAKELANFKSGLAVSPTSVSVASAILQLLHDEHMWKDMSNNALRFAKDHDWDVIADQMESLLRAVADHAEE